MKSTTIRKRVKYGDLILAWDSSSRGRISAVPRIYIGHVPAKGTMIATVHPYDFKKMKKECRLPHKDELIYFENIRKFKKD